MSYSIIKSIDGIEIARSDTPVEYRSATTVMESRVADIIADKEKELIWFLEHHNVYTHGPSECAHLVVDSRLPVVATGRGGKMTYHGPGQRIIYLMLDLRKRRSDLRAYLRSLEIWVVAALKNLGVVGSIVDGKTGVWVNAKKVASIGIRARKWVVFHGIGINLNTDMKYFSNISPCGLSPDIMSSLYDLGFDTITAHDLDDSLIKELSAIL